MAGGGWVATYEDVTERRAAEARLSHTARHDMLTGLPNRLLFSEYMPQALARARRTGGLAVLCLDLDRFKAVNDALGHAAGDALLQAVAQRLRDCSRESDLIVRLGGNEFAIVQEAATQPTEATALGRRLVETLAAPFDLDGQPVVIGTSVGIAMSDHGSARPETLLKCADLALYRAKAEGQGTYRFFETEMDTRMQMRRALELDPRRALAEEQFELFYQPLVKADGGGITGFEALLRWRHPERGRVSPAVFIPLAEEIGLIGAIGSLVLHRACADAASWPGALKVAVNLSPEQFRRRVLVDHRARGDRLGPFAGDGGQRRRGRDAGAACCAASGRLRRVAGLSVQPTQARLRSRSDAGGRLAEADRDRRGGVVPAADCRVATSCPPGQ